MHVTNPDGSSCGTPPCPILPGYNDPKHQVLLTMDWFGPVFGATTTVYKTQNGVGTVVPPCIKASGAYTNTPCIKKEKINKKTGQITDVLAILFGDPGVTRR